MESREGQEECQDILLQYRDETGLVFANLEHHTLSEFAAFRKHGRGRKKQWSRVSTKLIGGRFRIHRVSKTIGLIL